MLRWSFYSRLFFFPFFIHQNFWEIFCQFSFYRISLLKSKWVTQKLIGRDWSPIRCFSKKIQIAEITCTWSNLCKICEYVIGIYLLRSKTGQTRATRLLPNSYLHFAWIFFDLARLSNGKLEVVLVFSTVLVVNFWICLFFSLFNFSKTLKKKKFLLGVYKKMFKN